MSFGCFTATPVNSSTSASTGNSQRKRLPSGNSRRLLYGATRASASRAR